MNKKIALEATHKGNFKKQLGLDIDCYVLNDKDKTAVISQRGMGSAINLKGGGGNALVRFVNGKTIGNYIDANLKRKIDNPLKFKAFGKSSKGYDVTILIDICKSILKARDEKKIVPSQKRIVEQAQATINASAKVGIKGLVYALSGYDATRERIIEDFKQYIKEEARKYEEEFPPELYLQWYRIYELTKPPRNKPWKFKHLTMDQVYYPLAKSEGKIKILLEIQRSRSGSKSKRLHQFLSTVGRKALRTHLGMLLGIAKISKNKATYEKNVEKAFDLKKIEKK